MAVSLNYIWPATGAVAPTAVQMVNQSMMVVDVTATADADTTATIPHLMTGFVAGFTTPIVATLTPLVAQASTASPLWAATAVNAANVVLTKQTSAGSGQGSATVRCVIQKPATVIQ